MNVRAGKSMNENVPLPLAYPRHEPLGQPDAGWASSVSAAPAAGVPSAYSTVPTIDTLFLLNFIGAIVIAVGLIAPLGRVTGRHTDAVRAG